MEEFKKKVEKSKKLKEEDYARQLATRELLERDYKEDYIRVSFNTSPETRRTILARKPNQEEFIKILTMSLEAANPESSDKLLEMSSDLHKLAARLSVDKKLDEEFWAKKVSSETLQNFITELMIALQQGTRIPEEEMKKFR